MESDSLNRDDKWHRLRELASVFFRLGVTGFGGPAAHIAMMEEEVVRRRGWLKRQAFLDLLGATHLIPGPNSTELAIHIGYARAGWLGLAVAGSCFIFPAMVIVAACAWAYVKWGFIPTAAGILAGIKPVVVAVVLHALWGLGQMAVKDRATLLLGIATLPLALVGGFELAILFGAGCIAMMFGSRSRDAVACVGLPAIPWMPSLSAVAATSTAATASAGLWPIFGIFLKIGSVLYGSGYVLLAFLRADFVVARGWLTEAQLLDAVAVGQFTPGPVFTTATFVGYLLHGFSGAAVATIGIFLPAFLFVALSAPMLERWKSSTGLRRFLDGVNVASLSLMIAVTLHLARASLTDAYTWLMAAFALALLVRTRVNSAWLILAGGAIGWMRS